MYCLLYFQLLFISIILLTTKHCIANEAIDESREAFPEDFRDFLKGLSLMSRRRNEADTTTTRKSTLGSMRPEVLLSSQKSALRDMLMMKLVSYYEDKYRVSHHGTTDRPETLEPITLQTEPHIFTEGSSVDYDRRLPVHSLSRADDDMREKYPNAVAGVLII